MDWYRFSELVEFMLRHGCCPTGDVSPLGDMVWLSPNNVSFVLPLPQEDWIEATLIGEMLANQWIWTGPIPLETHKGHGTSPPT